MRSETCSRCGEEVRFGAREGESGWLHRERSDHVAILGTIRTPEMLAEDERQQHLVRTRVNDAGETIEYTAHGFGLKGDALKAYQAEMRGDKGEMRLPPVEIPCRPIGPEEFAPRSGIRQIINLLPKSGWEQTRLTHARGPYLGSSGESLGISDSVVLAGRGPQELDGSRRYAVASWRDGKFDFAYTGTIKDGQITATKVNATELKSWIKESA